jgi:hypothetical protein
MTAPLHMGSSANGASAGNLFVEADPEQVSERAAPARTGTAPRSRRGPGLVIPLDPQPSPAIAESPAARFTRSNRGIARLAAIARAQLRATDVRAAALLRRLAACPYGALGAATALAAMLIALSWLGLALRDASTSRHSAERARTAAAAKLTRDQLRIAELTVQLTRAEAAPRQQQASATETAALQARAIATERKPARTHHSGRR